MATTERIPRHLLPIIYVIDSSGSMTVNGNMSKVNEAMRNSIDLLKQKAGENADAEVLVGAMSFNTKAEWVFDGLVSTEDFYWNDIEANGLTNLGDALTKLNEKMSRSAYFKESIGYKCPVVIFMSDGYPNDDSWEKPLEMLRENKWFKYSIKIAIAVGEEVGEYGKDVLLKVIGDNPEGLIEIRETSKLKDLIQAVSLSASKIGSVSRPIESVKNDKGVKTAAKDIASAAVQNVSDASVPLPIQDANDDTNNNISNSTDASTVNYGGFDDGGWDN